ncbi:MAG: glycosyltransferase family 9 protein [Bacteroidaceae bacterium]
MIRKILVIRFRRVGDSVLSMSLCHSLKRSFPNAEIHFVINSSIASLYEAHPDMDRLIPFTPEELKGKAYLKKVKQVVRSTHYDVIIDMRSTIKTLPFSLYSLSTPYRIGRCKPYNWFVHNYRMKEYDSDNRVQSNLRLLEPLAKEGDLIKDESFPLFVTDEERRTFRAYMEEQGIDFSRPVILAAIATRIKGKSWPKERMIEVLRRIIDQYDAQLVFNYAGEAEARMAKDYYDTLEQDKHLFLNIEAKNLRQLCALCTNSHFFFGNEGGPRHISQAFEVPSFAIYPPNISKNFWLPGNGERYAGLSPVDILPLAQQKKMTYAERMAILTVDQVWEGLNEMLKKYL